MQIFKQDFPALTPGQMSPFNQAMRSGLESYQATTKAALMKPLLEADIASKTSYAKYLPYQQLATALSNPLVLAKMTPEQRTKMLTTLSEIPTTFSGQQINSTPKNQNPGLWDSLKSSLGFGDPVSSPEISNQSPPVQNQIDSYLGQNPLAASELQNSGQTVVGAPMTTSSPAAMPNQITPSVSGFPGSIIPPTGDAAVDAYLSQKYPSTERKIAVDAATAGAKGKASAEAKNNVKNLQKLIDGADESTSKAIKLEQNLDAFIGKYDKATLVGPALGKFSALGNDAATARNISTQLQTDVASDLFGSRITNYKEQLGANLKPNTEMSSKAVHDIYDRMKAGTSRVKEYQSFVDYANDMGVPANKIKKFWNDYNIEKPFYSVKQEKLIPENIGQFKEFIDRKIGNPQSSARNYNFSTGRIE